MSIHIPRVITLLNCDKPETGDLLGKKKCATIIAMLLLSFFCTISVVILCLHNGVIAESWLQNCRGFEWKESLSLGQPLPSCYAPQPCWGGSSAIANRIFQKFCTWLTYEKWKGLVVCCSRSASLVPKEEKKRKVWKGGWSKQVVLEVAEAPPR